MRTAVLLISLAQIAPGPLDAFRANYNIIRVNMEYEYVRGTAPADLVIEGRLWSPSVILLSEESTTRIEGSWSCDGIAESFAFGSPTDVIAVGEKKAVQEQLKIASGSSTPIRVSHVPRTVALYDGNHLAARVLDEPERGVFLRFWENEPPSLLMRSHAPFMWVNEYPFPQLLHEKFPKTVPVRRRGLRGGHPCEVELYGGYHKVTENWGHLMEVAYDPAIGYLPRFLRSIAFSEVNPTYVDEVYIVDAKPCGAGGFVPLEWYKTRYRVDRLGDTYNDDVVLSPNSRSISLGHFRATRIQDRTTPVALTQLDDVRWISGKGRLIPTQSGLRTLNLRDIQRKISAVPPMQHKLPTLDVADQTRFQEPPPRRWTRLVWWGTASFVLALAFFAFRRYRTLVILFASLGMLGCGEVEPVIKLGGNFKENVLLYDITQSEIPLTFLVKNNGNQPLRLLQGDGGCSCRQLDPSQFPVLLQPGASSALAVRINNNHRSTPQQFQFSFSTNHGSLSVPAVFHPLPRHQLEPANLTQDGLVDDSPWEFELVHRSIREAKNPKNSTKLIVPESFEVLLQQRNEGVVADAPQFRFADISYRIALKSRQRGFHKEILSLEEADGSVLAEATVVWRRIPFLSSTPEVAPIGLRPLRVFLRCPDERVELTQVVSCPTGVKAIVSSPRELTIIPTSDAPERLRDFIEVETTAVQQPPLRIPIVRYAPTPAVPATASP